MHRRAPLVQRCALSHLVSSSRSCWRANVDAMLSEAAEGPSVAHIRTVPSSLAPESDEECFQGSSVNLSRTWSQREATWILSIGQCRAAITQH